MTEPTQKERTRARILDEAAWAMREHGSDGIGVAALMKRAGLTHGGFYAHFKDRDDLVAHAVDRMFADSGRMLHRHFGQNDAAEGLRGLINYYLSDEMRLAADRGWRWKHCACPSPKHWRVRSYPRWSAPWPWRAPLKAMTTPAPSSAHRENSSWAAWAYKRAFSRCRSMTPIFQVCILTLLNECQRREARRRPERPGSGRCRRCA